MMLLEKESARSGATENNYAQTLPLIDRSRRTKGGNRLVARYRPLFLLPAMRNREPLVTRRPNFHPPIARGKPSQTGARAQRRVPENSLVLEKTSHTLG